MELSFIGSIGKKPKGKKYHFEDAERFDAARAESVVRYLYHEAHVLSWQRSYDAFLINDKEWKYNFDSSDPAIGYCFTGSIIVEDGVFYEGIPVLIRKKDDSTALEQNAVFAHEALGHLGFRVFVEAESTDYARMLGEAFSRVLSLILSGEREKHIEAVAKHEPKYYLSGTSEVVRKVYEIYDWAGMRAVISAFYSMGGSGSKAEHKPGNTIIEWLFEDREFLLALSVFSAMHGGHCVKRFLQMDGPRDFFIKQARAILDGTCRKSSQVSEYELMKRHLKNEFSLGQSVSEEYLSHEQPSSLEELIKNKQMSKINMGSGLKWEYAHNGVEKPDYQRGMDSLEMEGLEYMEL